MNLSVAKIQEVYFAAMRCGYAFDGPKYDFTDGGNPGYRFEEGDWIVTDRYKIIPDSDYSFGHTVIYYQGQPVWDMSYRGWYDRIATDFLKSALRVTYGRGEFLGGRGPGNYQDKKYSYRNFYREFPEVSNFCNFQNREDIHTISFAKLMGEHCYFGGILFKLDPDPADAYPSL